MADEHRYTIFQTGNGFIALAWGSVGVSGLRLPAGTEAAAEAAIVRCLPHSQRASPPAPIASIARDVVRYFDGERVDFTDVPVDLGAQSPFFSGVYAHVRALGWGETTTYGEVARALGAGPQAARNVGQAMANNPVPLIVPCHRVLAAGRKIGGFSAPGGSSSKVRMLEMEGVDITPEKPAPVAKLANDQPDLPF